LSISFKNQTITTQKRETKMKKTLLALLSATLLLTVITPAQAEDQKVLAIIDSAIDSRNFSSIIHEVCFNTYKNSCPNNTNYMEGKGSAALTTWPADSNNMSAYHGDSMVKAALAVNPNIKIVFIRYAEQYTVSVKGKDTVMYTNWADSLSRSIDWISKNAEKYSIDAVSLSQSGLNATLSKWCTTDKMTISSVALLNTKNIPVFAATGNDASSSAVGFPACVSGVVGVGSLASLQDGILETATNRGPGLDMVALAGLSITKVNGAQFNLAGSSGATVVSASLFLKNNKTATFQEYINTLPKITVKAMDRLTKKFDPAFSPTVPYSSN